MTAPRSSNGVVATASISTFCQPAPMPMSSRPPDSTSIVVSILAATIAGRCGTTMTASTQADFVGLRGDPGGGGQLLHAVAGIGRVEFAGFRIRVAGRGDVRQGDMVGQGEIFKAQFLAESGDAGDVGGGGHGAGDGQVEADAHERDLPGPEAEPKGDSRYPVRSKISARQAGPR